MHGSVALLSVSLIVAAPRAQTWSRAEAVPGPRSEVVLTHDRARDRIVLFGHSLGDDVTWEWNGSAWSPRHADPYPTVGMSHALVFDDVRRTNWLFDFGSRETWTYDGRVWTQTALPMAPPYRELPAIVFDEQRGVAVMFGGLWDHHTVHGDTWEWDGAAWSQRQPPVVPAARAAHALAYDPVAGHVLMFGGTTLQGLLDDTWAWDGTLWVQQQAFVHPSARYGSKMGFDPVQQRPLLYGGAAQLGALDETWTWTGANWQQLQPATTPSRGAGGAMAVHDGSGLLVLQGGDPPKTWGWNGTDWLLLYDPQAPVLVNSAAAVDRARGRIVVFGDAVGNSTNPPPVPTGTWEWDGGQWHRLQPVVEPPSRSYGSMAHDPVLGRTILHGGRVNQGYQLVADTWEWDGSQWTQRTPALAPLVSIRATMYFDGALGGNVLVSDMFAGAVNGYFEFLWTGSTWQSLPPAGIGAFRAATYDEARGVSVAVTSLGTFERSGGAWTQVGGPGPFIGNFDGDGMAYDPESQRVVAIAYTTAQGAWSMPAWQWDGSAWTALPTADGHGYGAARLLVEDPTRGRLALIGGNGYFAARRWHLTTTPALGDTFGTSCNGTSGEVTVTARGLPRTGNAAFGVDVDHALPNALVLLGISIGQGNTPLGNGCSWYLGNPIASHLLVANGAGFQAVDLPIPSDVSFRGLVLAAQAFALDPGGPHLGALAASAGLRIVIGD